MADSSDSDEYGTPAHIIRLFHAALGGLFDLDPAAGAEAIQIAKQRFTKAQNGLAQDWNGSTIWLNPPYSDPKPWFKKLQRELARDDPESPNLILALVPADPSTAWFKEYGTGEYISLVHERISFVGGGNKNDRPNVLIAFGDVTDAIIEAMDQIGTVYRRETVTAAADQMRLDDLLSDGGIAAAAGGGTLPTSGLAVSLDRLQAHDRVTLEFDTSRLGAVYDLPERVTVGVLPDGRTFNTETGEIQVDMLGAHVLENGEDLYVQVRESAYAATRVEVAVSVSGRPWELAPVERIVAGVEPTAMPTPEAV